jgi:hypothetical protein
MAVQEAAAKNKISNYFTLEDVSANGIYHALKQGLVAIGVKNFKGVGPHFLVAFDVTPDGLALKCANWWKQDVQDVVEVDFADVVTAVTLEDMPQYASAAGAQMPKFLVFWKNLAFHKMKVFGAALLSLVSGSAMQFGAGYTPVTDYSSNTTQYISSTATTIPVASTKDKAGNEIVMASIGGTAYFTIEPGTSREEIAACTSKSVGQWSNCLRGLPFQGGSLTPSTTLQYAHNAGSRIVMSDVGQFFTEFVSVTGTQTIYDLKTFNTIPGVTSTTAIPGTDNLFATKYYVDQVGAGGFTASNIGSGYGLKALGTVPEKVAIDISATSSGLMFGGIAANQLQVQTSSTGGIAVNGIGSLYLDTSDAQTWTGAWTLNNQVTVSAGSGALYVPTPTDVANPVPLNYAQVLVALGQATGTAQVAITAGQALWMSATSSQIMVTNSNVASSTFQFIGIAASTTSAGQTVTYTKPGGINCNQSGLTSGIGYYLNGTAGQVASTGGTFFAKVGRATSANCLLVESPKFLVRGTISVPASTAAIYTNVGFYPAHITIMGISNAGAGNGYSIGDDTNNNIYQNGSAGSFATSSNAYYIRNNTPTTLGIGTVSSKDAFGFTITPSDGTAPVRLQYAAWSE